MKSFSGKRTGFDCLLKCMPSELTANPMREVPSTDFRVSSARYNKYTFPFRTTAAGLYTSFDSQCIFWLLTGHKNSVVWIGVKIGLSTSCFTNGVIVQEGCWAKMVDTPSKTWNNVDRKGILKWIRVKIYSFRLIIKIKKCKNFLVLIQKIDQICKLITKKFANDSSILAKYYSRFSQKIKIAFPSKRF